MARSPATQISRLWVQGWLSISQIPASGSVHRAAMASAAAIGGLPVVGVQSVGPAGRGEQQQRFAERVELELLVDPVPDQVRAAGVAGKVQGRVGPAPPHPGRCRRVSGRARGPGSGR